MKSLVNIMSIYDQYPEFINSDPRINRTKKSYKITKEFTDARYSCFFDIDLTDKSVLDLGSCVGSLGAWVLEKGAKFYRGVEFDKDLAETGSENLKKYFSKDKWDIQNTSVEAYFKDTDTKFDIVVASGIIYAFFDPIPILEKISEIGNLIIIESRSQTNRNQSTVLDEAPYITFGNRQRMIIGVTKSEVEYYSSSPSIGFFKYYFKLMGFDYDPSTHDRLKEMIPEYYWYGNRFALRFKRNNAGSNPLGFIDSLEVNSVLYKWSDN